MEVPWRFIKKLYGKKARDETGLTVAEGPAAVLCALESSVEIRMIVVAEDFLSTDKGQEVREAIARRTDLREVFIVSRSLYNRMSDTASPQGVLCVIPWPFRNQPPKVWSQDLIVVGVDIQDPGNVGTLIRASSAVGATEVIFCGNTADPFSPKAIRSSAGAVFATQVRTAEDPLTVVRDLAASGIRFLRAVPRDGVPPWKVEFRSACAILLGNEAAGLREEILELPGGEDVSIPMPGGTESLNVAMACSMILYEALRQRMEVL